MKFRVRKTVTISIASLFAVALLLIIFGKRNFGYRALSEDSELIAIEIEAYSEGINSILYDQNGEISYTLRADSQVHYKDGNTRIERPLIRLFQDEVPRWNIVANEGEVIASITNSSSELEKKNLKLHGNVELLGLDKFGNRVFITTELLEIDPISETLRTDHRVEYESTNIQHSSIGMFANLRDEEIIFDKNVRGFYEKISN